MPKSNAPQTPDTYKIVYFGVTGSGKRTNLNIIQRTIAEGGDQGALQSGLQDGTPLVVDIPAGFLTSKKLAIVTACEPAGSHQWLSVLHGVHGVVFVADSEVERYNDNIVALAELIGRLAHYRIKIENFPFVLQYNKRDLDDATAVARFEDELNPLGAPAFNTVARDGTGVMQCLKGIAHLIDKAWKIV